MSKWLQNNAIIKKIKSIKHIEIYIAVIFIVIIVAIWILPNKKSSTNAQISSSSSTYEYANYMEDKLSSVLSKVKGAGEVNVLVVVESSSEMVYAINSESKTNTVTSGSITTVVEEPILITSQGSTTPLVIKEYMPKITGVIVVAQGAGSISVKLELLKALQAIIDVPTSNIEILVGNK